MKQTISSTLRPLYTITEKWFSASLNKFAEVLTDNLITRAEQSNVTSVQSDCFSALNSLRKSSDNAIQAFLKSLAGDFHSSPKNQVQIEKISDFSLSSKKIKDELNLVATKDLEENLSFETAVEKITKQHREAFEHLEIRITEKLKQHNEQIAKTPLSAENILRAFRDSMKKFDFSPEIRIHTYKLFEQFLSNHISELLEQLNDALISQGILPKIKTSYALKKAPKDSTNAAPESSETQQETAAEPTEQAPPAPGGISQFINNPTPYATPQATTIPQASAAPRPGTTAPASSAVNSSPAASLNNRYLNLARQLSGSGIAQGVSKTPPDMPPVNTPINNQTAINTGNSTLPEQGVTTANKQLNSLLNQTSHRASHEDTQNNLLSLQQIYASKQQNISLINTAKFVNKYDTSTDELINALMGIQYNYADVTDSGTSAKTPHSVHRQIKANILASTNKSPETTQLKNKRLYLIDMIEDLFTHIADNKKLSLSAKGLFRRLMIPIIHLALVDDTFINNTKHPARLFLDDFADASLGASDEQSNEDNPVYLKLKKMATQLGRENKINTSIFTELHTDLQRFINYRKQLANNSSVSSRTSVKMKIDAIVKHCTKDKNIPQGIDLILNKIWKNVMLNIYLDDSCDSDERERTTAFVNSLIFSVQRAQTDIAKNRLERLIPIIKQEMEAGLIRINCPWTLKQKISLYLQKFHQFALGAAYAEISKDSPVETQHENENEAVIYKNELFDDADSSSNNEPPQPSTISDELILFDQEINTIAPATIVNSIEEAFTQSSKDSQPEPESPNKLLEATHKAENPQPEKQSKTDFELIRLVSNSYKMTPVDDQYTSATKNLETGCWLEFRFKYHFSRAQITWVEDDKSLFNCLTQNNRVIEISLAALSDSFRLGVCSVIPSSVIDDAIQAVSNDLHND